MSRNRTSVIYALRWDLTAVLVLIMLAGAYWWLKEPTLRLAGSDTISGSRPPDRAEGDILLLLPDSPSATASNFDELDCSYGWFNSLWQEYGSFATALTRDLSPEILAGRSVVIVPSRVARNMPTAGVRAIGDFAKRGGQVILEQPNDAWLAVAASTLTGKPRRAQHITSIEGLGVHGDLREQIAGIPLTGVLMPAPAAAPFPEGASIMDIDDQPGWAVTQVGEGWVHTLYFNLGCSVTALQQGLPTRDMVFGKDDKPEIHASLRRSQPDTTEFPVPYADLLERAVLQRLSVVRPIPRLWLYPGNYAGAMVMTHPAPDASRSGLALADAAHRAGASATVFMTADLFTSKDATFAESIGADVGLLWVRGKRRELVLETVGIGPLQPIANELDLNTQFTRVNIALPEARPLRVARVEESAWANDWSTTFQQLAAARLRLDSSFGPKGGTSWGYLFGTGFPFYPLDERGLPLPLVEQPYVMEGSGASPQRLESMLRGSAQGFHQSIVVSISSDIMRYDPAPGVLLTLRDAFTLAKKHNHWATSLGELLDFLAARRKSVLTSQWSAEERRLTITVNLLGTQSDRVAAEENPEKPKDATAGVAFPRVFDGEEVESVTLDQQDVPLKEIATTGSSTDRILIVPPGRHTIVVHYKSPAPAAALIAP
ncbi:MAG: hypothetical protein R3E66_09530 [bacterium]